MSAIQLKDVISELKSMGDSDATAAAGLSGYGDDGDALFFWHPLFFHDLPALHLLFNNAGDGFHMTSFHLPKLSVPNFKKVNVFIFVEFYRFLFLKFETHWDCRSYRIYGVRCHPA
jgi:hypothetical protein